MLPSYLSALHQLQSLRKHDNLQLTILFSILMHRSHKLCMRYSTILQIRNGGCSLKVTDYTAIQLLQKQKSPVLQTPREWSAKVHTKVQYYFADSLKGVFLQSNRLHSYTTAIEAKLTRIADTVWVERKSSHKKLEFKC